MDVVLHLMMETWLEQREADKAKVVTVFEQALPANGILTKDDFKAMMRCISLELCSLLPDRIVTEMYREALQLSDKGHRITADAFFQVCAQFEGSIRQALFLQCQPMLHHIL
ncbi:MAG: hypothetical protein HC767_08235 [Akkermansiaceae bacterium]|nr:hypothetical protein [Akkermansiaceae bacterium]